MLTTSNLWKLHLGKTYNNIKSIQLTQQKIIRINKKKIPRIYRESIHLQQYTTNKKIN